MHVPKHYEESRVDVLHELMAANPFATVTMVSDAKLEIAHMPLVVDKTQQPYGMLRGHVARANPLWRASDNATETVVVFHGPHAYVTPSWYPSKQAHGKVVPTWNYAVVHAHGVPRAVHDTDWLREHLTELTGQQEAGKPTPWKLTDAPAEYIDTMLKAIVGIEFTITALVGKWKLSQNKSHADRLGVVEGLSTRDSEGCEAAVARLVRNALA